MTKILKDPDIKSNHKKYGHDMSMIRKFSSAVGQLLPVYYDFLLPGDSIRCNTEMFTQVTDITAPAMMHITEHVDWFFVPLSHICSIAPDKLFGIDDFKSSLIPQDARELSVQTVVPSLDLSEPDLAVMYITSSVQTESYGSIRDSPNVFAPEWDTVDEFGVPHIFNVMRLQELLGFSRRQWNDLQQASQMESYQVSPIYAAAYQKIFFDNYRITDRTPNDVSSYNLDSFIEDWQVNGTVARKLFRLRYRAFQRDYFQLTKVAPLIDYGSVGMLDRQREDEHNSLAYYLQYLGETANSNVNGDASYNKSISSYGDLNTATIRGMFAAEKLMEITRRAAKHYDSQVLAHFGYKVPQGVSGEVYRLGSEKSVLAVNEVFGTAAGSATKDGVTVTSSLGEKGGRAAGYSPSGKNIKFTAPCHGVLMAIYSAVPDSDYLPDGLDKLNTATRRYDFFLPEFDRLGMQPLFGYESYFTAVGSGFNNTIVGWQYRYMQNKLKYNMVNGAFNTKYKDWTIARDHIIPSNNAQYYIYPQFMDSVLLLSFQNADTDKISYNQCYARDYLLHWFRFNVQKSSIMSTYSLPSL